MTARDLATGAVSHWEHLAPVLTEPQSSDDCEHLVAVLDAGGADETSSSATLAVRIGDLIEAYERKNLPVPDASPAEVLVFLMEQHGVHWGVPRSGTACPSDAGRCVKIRRGRRAPVLPQKG